MMRASTARRVLIVLLLPFVMFIPVTGYWHCEDKVCGYWLGKNCCEHPEEVGAPHSHVDHRHAAEFSAEHHEDCAFQCTSGSEYSPSTTLTTVHAPVAIVPSPAFESANLPYERPIRIREGRGPPDRILAFLNNSLRAPPIS
jgi:hypothetical protein